MVWKARKDMTQSVTAAAAPRGSWETDVMNPSATQSSSASSLTPVGWGVNSCWSDSPVSHRQKAEQSCVVSTLALRLLHVDPHRSWLWVIFFMAETPFNSFVQCPEGRGEKKKSTGNEQHDEDAKPEFCFLHGSIISRVTLLWVAVFTWNCCI